MPGESLNTDRVQSCTWLRFRFQALDLHFVSGGVNVVAKELSEVQLHLIQKQSHDYWHPGCI